MDIDKKIEVFLGEGDDKDKAVGIDGGQAAKKLRKINAALKPLVYDLADVAEIGVYNDDCKDRIDMIRASLEYMSSAVIRIQRKMKKV